ncbi:MAG: hypothetical protein MUC96_19915 [Myxococcaceae bacterium]|jgi:hypothetical protein|nr:hypothetical protein [Myxococcaceae bacterium]
MNRFSRWSLVVGAVVVAGCNGSSVDSQRAAVQTLTCPKGQVPFNFSKFTSPMTTEGLSSLAPNAPLPRPKRKPNVITVTRATCNVAFDWTSILGEFCDGRESCVVNRGDCPGNLQYAYTCSDAPNDVQRAVCPSTYNCLGTMSCRQPPPVVDPLQPADKVACVPESCGIGQRRDKDLNCVDAPERPVELANLYVENLRDYPWDDEYLENRAWVSELTTPYPPVGLKNFTGGRIADFDFAGVWPWAPGGPSDSASFPFFQGLTADNNFAGRYRVLFAGAFYTMKGGYRFADTRNVPLAQKARKGSLTMYLVDEYGTSTAGPNGAPVWSVTDSVVRCVLHEFDLGKYTPKPAADGRADNFFVEFEEGIVVPRDCEEGGPIWSENVKVLAKKYGKTPLDFVNSTRLMRTRLQAAYDIAGRVTYVSQKKSEAATACNPNPLDMYYNTSLETHDKVAYYKQRAIPLSFSFTGNDVNRLPPGTFAYRLENGGVHVRGATKTSVGITDVRPKKVEFKFKSANRSRQFFRADVDWFMSGDNRDFWKTQGLTGEVRAKMTLSLVPLNADMTPRLQDALLLGPSPLLTSTPAGETQAMRFEVTKEVRDRFLDKSSPYYATERGTPFMLRSCLSLVRVSGNEELPVPKFEGKVQLSAFTASADNRLRIEPGVTGQERLEVLDAFTCVTGAMPIVVKLDPSVAPLAADEADQFSDSDPQAAGDARVSQTYDQDNDRRCVKAMVAGRNGEHCDSRTISGLGGSTAATILRTEVSNVDKGDAVVATKEAELMGLQVFDEEEEKQFEFMSNRANFTITVAPNFDSIADAINAANTGSTLEAEEKRFSVGVSGLGLALSIKIPLRYGPVQGEIIFEISAGVGVGAELKFTQERETHTKCADGTNNCDALYFVGTTPLNFRQARAACLARNGGRLADLRVASESTKLRARLAAGQEYWIGAQVADEYMKNCADLARTPTAASQAVFRQNCASQHKTHLRWLSNDEDFATRAGNGAFVADLTEIEPGTPSLTLRGVPLELPKERGVSLTSTGEVNTPELSTPLPYVCKSPDSNYAVKNEAQFKIVLAAAAGMKLAFCTPSADAGVCVEGSLNFIEATLEPSITYTHVGVGDSGGTAYISRSNVKLALEFGLTALNGSVDAKVVFSVGVFDFEFKYNIVEFSGFKIPTGDPVEKEIPLTGEPQ